MSTIRRLVLFGCSVCALGCETLVAPAREARVYVLVSIAGVPIQSLANVWSLCSPAYAADGAELAMLADTIFLNSDGSGEERNLARIRHAVWERATPDEPAFLSPHRSAFTWRMFFRDFRVFVERADAHGTVSIPIANDGSIEIGDGTCGIWRFAQVSAPWAP